VKADAIGRAMASAAMAPLTREQRVDLAILARNAYGMAEGPDAPSRGFEAWRHRQTMMVAECAGLRECRQEDYCALRAHFLGVLAAGARRRGIEPVAASAERLAGRWRDRGDTEAIRVARAALNREFARTAGALGRPAEYAAEIARCKFKTTALGDLSARQVWALVFDVRRAAARKAKGGAA
jgi:hypothetical protein